MADGPEAGSEAAVSEPARRLLMIGSSNISFNVDGPSVADVLLTTLNDSGDGGTWRLIVDDAGPGRSMATTAERLARENHPDVVLISLAAGPFTYEFVVNRIRRRWPRFHKAVLSFSQWLKDIAGGDSDTPSGPRSLLYRIPEWIALQTIGGETALPLEHAIANTVAALEALVRLEEAPVLVRLPMRGRRAAGARLARYEERIRIHRNAVEEVCRRHRIPCVDIVGELGGRGEAAQRGFDGIHLGPESRRLEAEILAREVLAAAGASEKRARRASRTGQPASVQYGE